MTTATQPPPGALGSHAEPFPLHFVVGLDLGRRARPSNPPLAEHVDFIGEIAGEMKALLDQQNGEAFLLESAQALLDVSHDDRRESLGQLVENEALGIEQQRSGDGEHLLLAAGKLIGTTVSAFPKLRKYFQHALEGRRAGSASVGEQEVFPDAQSGEKG